MKVVCLNCGDTHERPAWIFDPIDAVIHKVGHCEKCEPEHLYFIPNWHYDKNGKRTDLTEAEWEHINNNKSVN